MAQIIANKNPIDSQPRRAVGFGFPLNGNAVFVPTYQTRDQIKANLVNFLLTNKGERVFNPNFGADLRSTLFEQLENSTLEELSEQIQEYIGVQFPTIAVEEIAFTPQEDKNTLFFTLTYTVVLLGFRDEVNILLQ
jgi:phage baseplate assembly protein W|tara:strand:+ start:2457 stop:2864 length:408 start_codon:yes stop_codon:yes gene_type:complete